MNDPSCRSGAQRPAAETAADRAVAELEALAQQTTGDAVAA
ncbi:hypothetical protein ABZ914_40450 [Spirillospora sp. NPDC046719]